MRFIFLAVIFLSGLLSFAKDTPKAMLVVHNDIKGPIIGFAHTEDFEIFADGRVRYSESGNDRKTGTFNIRLTPAQLHRLTALLNSKEMRTVPAEIPSQIRVVDFDWEAQLNFRHGSDRQTIAIKNFYPMLNTQRPTYPKSLIELECFLRDVQARATKRPVHTEDEDWCPEKAQ
ncbi:MAG: hypothetical protein LAO76_03685 [Acidobacteriia bacterium]|nr:hypothetical protein [Terriglobia bacterium]